jgi:hypothetical protein
MPLINGFISYSVVSHATGSSRGNPYYFQPLTIHASLSYSEPVHVFIEFSCFRYSYSFCLIAGGMMSLLVKSKTTDSVLCEVVDGGELKSRRHLNVRGKSATLPSITGIFYYSVAVIQGQEGFKS